MNRTKILILGILLSSFSSWSYSQISVESAAVGLFTPEELIYQVFLGSGIEIVDVTHSGQDASVGFFSNGDDDIRISEGIVMTTGEAIFAQNPNTAGGTTGSWGAPGTDPDLDPIASGNLFDISSYEITFIPSGDSIRFNYVFASEEYPEWACTAFNDVFGFFLEGPIPGGGDYNGKNIALVPDPADISGLTPTTVPVAINNINGNGIDMGNGCDYDYANYYNDNSSPPGQTPTYDAFLDVFIALAEVIPCEEYTIKLIVADVGDDQLDTGIFLEGRSFGGGVPNIQAVTVGQDGVIAEGCAQGTLEFTLPFPADQDVDLNFSVIGTADWGVDYEPFETSITITPPNVSYSIPINVIDDAIVENLESIGIDIQLTPCRRDTFFFFIEDSQLVEPDLPDELSNCAGPVQLDGTLPIPLPEPDTFYSQDTPAAIPEIPDNNPPAPGTILPFYSEIQVFGVQPAQLQAGMIKEVCINVEHGWDGDVDAYLFSPGGKFIELTTDNGGSGNDFIMTCFSPNATMQINDFPGGQAPNTIAPFTDLWLPEGSFDVLYDQGSGDAPVNGIWRLAIKDDGLNIVGTLLSWSISFESNYTIEYNWSPAAGLTCTDCPNPIADPASETMYYLSVTDVYGCEVIDSVLVNQGLSAEGVLVDSVSCFGGNDGAATLQYTMGGGTPPYQYEWFDGLQDSVHTNLAAGIYDVSYTDANGCMGVIAVEVLQPDQALSLSTTTVDLCPDASGMGEVSVTPTGGTADYTYQWDANAGSSTASMVSNLGQGQYSVTVTDANNCMEESIAIVNIAPDINMAISGDTITCHQSPADMIAVNSNGGNGGFSYNWSNGLGTDSTLNNVNAGTYQVSATDINGCEAVLDVNIVDQGPLLLEIDTQDPECDGVADGSAEILSATIGGNPVALNDLSFNWSHGSGNNINQTSLPGDTDIIITATDALQCISESTINLDYPENYAMDLINTDSVTCYGDENGMLEVSLTGGVGQLQYSWPDLGSSDAIVSNLSAGTYSFQAMDLGTSCPAWDTTFTVYGPESIDVESVTGFDGCSQETGGFASLAISGGNGNFDIVWSDNQMGTMLEMVEPGDYTYTIIDAKGCDTIGMVTIEGMPSLMVDVLSPDLTCRQDSNGIITVDIADGQGDFTYSLDGENYVSNPVFVGLHYGAYDVWIQDDNGCEFLASSTFIDAPPLFEIEMGEDFEIELGEEPELEIELINGQGIPNNWDWNWGVGDAELLSCDVCPVFNVEGLINAHTFNLVLTDAAGCVAQDQIKITINKNRIFQVPTGFTPNGDNFNDLLLTHGDERAMVHVFRLYDRWGTLIWEDSDFQVGDLLTGWNGTYLGKALEPGVFVWYAEVLFSDGQSFQYKGQTTLIR